MHRAHAHLFFTLQALGKLDELHAKVFEEIHQNNNLFVRLNGDPLATQRAQLQFKNNGISESDFMNAYNSFGVQTKMQEAR